MFFYNNFKSTFQDKSYTTFNPATPRSPSPTLDGQLEVHLESNNMDKTTPKELSPATTGMQSPTSGRAEPAGIAPTRCLSPSATPSRQEHKCGPCGSEVVNHVVDENSSVSLSRRLLQEVKLDYSTQHKVLLLSTILTNNRPHTDCYGSMFCMIERQAYRFTVHKHEKSKHTS